MPCHPKQRQQANDVLVLDWAPDEEHPIAPRGYKPKATLVAPSPPLRSYIVGGHRYLFKTPEGAQAQQIWSEVIAYELGKSLGVAVPPAFLAVDAGSGQPGVLVEFFFGHPGEHPPLRFFEGAYFLEGMGVRMQVRHGGLRDNLRACRTHRVPGWRSWWATTLAFDAIIGNTDRHSENWGFLIDHSGAEPAYSMAPPFDNGTSLGQIVRDAEIPRHLEQARLERFLRNGKHHYDWLPGQPSGAPFSELCRMYLDVYGSGLADMTHVAELNDATIDEILHWCTQFDFPVPFTPARAEFVSVLTKLRRTALAQAIGI